jgi:hypothetical protein
MRNWAAHSTRILSTLQHVQRSSVGAHRWMDGLARASTAAYNCPVHADMRRPGVRPRYAAIVPDGGELPP